MPLAVIFAAWVACSPTSEHVVAERTDSTERSTAEGSSDGEEATLESRFERAAARAERTVASAQGVAAAREAAALALELHALQNDREALVRARHLLEEAARRRALPGACEASLELARLEARHAADAQAAYVEAYRTVARFGRDGAHAECIRQARWMLGVLDAYRPPASRLAPIDSDPDAADPSVAVIPSAPPPASSASAQVSSATLKSLEVYAAAGQASEQAHTARVVLRFDGAPLFRRGELAATPSAPRQTFLQFENVALAPEIRLPQVVGQGGLLRVARESGRPELRLVFDLQPDARYRLFSMTAPHRLVLDVRRPKPKLAPGDKRGPLVVLDPGHGGEDRGAKAPNGLTEAKLTLDIARRVRAWLDRIAPDVRVRMTRDSDVLLSLEERAAMANALGADLFLSVHLNASSQPIERGGVATFVLDVNNDRNVLRLAARENGTGTQAVTELQFLVGSLARAEQARESRAAARWIQQGTLFGGRRFLPQLNDRGVRSAMFYVLVGAQMPAVLVEASFLTQQEEAELLAREAYRDGLAEGIARGTVKYLQSQSSQR